MPVNSRPYRYSPLHKDEIERHVSEMLASGLIKSKHKPFCVTRALDPKEGWILAILRGLSPPECPHSKTQISDDSYR